jgi:glycosidase
VNYVAWENLPALPKFNFKNAEVKEFILGVAKHWLELGIDGWRLDVPFEIEDEFWPVFRKVVKDINPEAYIVGEIWVNEVKSKSKRWLKGDMFDAVMNYGLLGACVSFFIGDKLNKKNHIHQDHYTGEVFDAKEFAKRLEYLLKLNPLNLSLNQYNLLESHDTSRFITIANNKTDTLKLAYLFLFSFPGAPSIYYGSEVGVKGKHDPDCRRTIPWETDKLDTCLLEYFKKLSQVRHESVALRRGDFKPLFSDGKRLAFLREFEGKKAIVLINNEAKAVDFEFTIDHETCNLKCPISGLNASIKNNTFNSDSLKKISGAIYLIN